MWLLLLILAAIYFGFHKYLLAIALLVIVAAVVKLRKWFMSDEDYYTRLSHAIGSGHSYTFGERRIHINFGGDGDEEDEDDDDEDEGEEDEWEEEEEDEEEDKEGNRG